jgi:hypothetical protein
MTRTIDCTLEEIIACWEENSRNIYRVAKVLGISVSTVRRKLLLSGLYTPKEIGTKPFGAVLPRSVETIDAMTPDAIRGKFKLEEGTEVWVLNHKNKPVLKRIEKANKHNIQVKNKYGRTECFTFGDILTGYVAKTGKETEKWT